MNARPKRKPIEKLKRRQKSKQKKKKSQVWPVNNLKIQKRKPKKK